MKTVLKIGINILSLTTAILRLLLDILAGDAANSNDNTTSKTHQSFDERDESFPDNGLETVENRISTHATNLAFVLDETIEVNKL